MFLTRNVAEATEGKCDIAVIGGGIYGSMLAHEAARGGLRAVLFERDDFGQHTSFNSLRIVHGGLRYLQSLDIQRFRESVAERTWFLRHFPDFVRPIPCLMPLYGNGLKRPLVFHAALLLNHLLSRNRNRGLPAERQIPFGAVLDAATALRLFPAVDPDGLKGAALWYDAIMEDSQCLLMEILRRAALMGAVVLNYMEVVRLTTHSGDVTGLAAVDRETGRLHEVRARAVVNAAGPWSREMAARFHRDIPDLFTPSLSWNVLFDMAPPSDHAVAVTPRRPGAQTFFLVPWKGSLLAGTGHASCSRYDGRALQVSAGQLKEFIRELNEALPAGGFRMRKVAHVFSGLLPVAEMGSTALTHREVILDHSKNGGPRGFFSVSGIKFTTARRVAEKALGMMFPGFSAQRCGAVPPLERGEGEMDGLPPVNSGGSHAAPLCVVRSALDDESVRHLDDLMLRRLPLKRSPAGIIEEAARVCRLLNWDEDRSRQEMERLRSSLNSSSRWSQDPPNG